MANDETPDTPDTDENAGERHAHVAGKSEVRQATGYDDGAVIAATDPADSNDERYDAGAQTGDTEADTADTEANTTNS